MKDFFFIFYNRRLVLLFVMMTSSIQLGRNRISNFCFNTQENFVGLKTEGCKPKR